VKTFLTLALCLSTVLAEAGTSAKNSAERNERMRLTSFEAGSKKQISAFETSKNGKKFFLIELQVTNQKTKKLEVTLERFQLLENLAFEQTWENNYRSKSKSSKCEQVFEIDLQALKERSQVCKGEAKREFNTKRFFGQILKDLFPNS
jgi:hypothetical protein